MSGKPGTRPRKTTKAKAKEAEKSAPPLRDTKTSGQAKTTVAQIAEALRLTGGIKSAAAAKLGIKPSTMTDYFKRHPELNEVLAEVEDGLLDLAESRLLANVKKGDQRAVEFYLLTKGKRRGYTKRIEATGAGGAPLVAPEVTIRFVKAKPEVASA